MNRNLRLLGVGVAIRTFGNALYFPFLALFLLNVLHVDYIEIGIIIAGIGVVQLPFNYAGGLITDRLGRRRLILIGLVAECAATAGLAYAFEVQSLAGAIAAGTMGGIVTSAAGPASSAYIADFAAGSERTRGFTFYRIGFNAGYSAGVTLGGVLVGVIGFSGAVAIAAVIIGSGAVFLAASLEPSPRDLELRAIGPARTLAGPAPRTEAPRRSLAASFRVLARDRVALELMIAFAFGTLVAGQWAITFPLYVHNVLGIPYAFLGAGLALNGLVVVFGQSATTESVVGRRHTTIAAAGIGLYALGFVGLGAAGLFGVIPTAVFFVAVIVLTVGESLVTIPFSTLPSNVAPPEEVGSYNGAFTATSSAGFLVAVLLGGFVLAGTANPLLIWLILVAPVVPTMILLRDAARRLSPAVDRA